MQPLGLVALLLEIAPVLAGVSPLMRFGERSWTPARETGSPATAAGGDGEGRLSPRPTEPARHPDFGQAELLRRYDMGSDTCGFASGVKSEPWTCLRVGAVCATTGLYLGCCSGSSPACLSTFLTTCREYKTQTGSTTSSTSCGRGTLCCGGTLPECFTWRFSTSASPGSTYSLFNCYGKGKGGIGTLVDAPPGLSLTSGILSSTSNPNPSTSDDATSTTAPGGGGSSSTPVGAIVGGVVGGLAVIGIAVVALFWLFYRQRRTHDPPQPSMAGSTLGGSVSPAGTAGTYYAFNRHPDDAQQQQRHQSMYGPGVHGYYAGEQKAPGQPGYDPHASFGGQPQFPQQQVVSELPSTQPQRHELD